MQLSDEGDVFVVRLCSWRRGSFMWQWKPWCLFGLYLPVIPPTSPPTTTAKAPIRTICRCSPRGKWAETLLYLNQCLRLYLGTTLSAAFSCRRMRLPGSVAFGGNDGGFSFSAHLHALLLQPWVEVQLPTLQAWVQSTNVSSELFLIAGLPKKCRHHFVK